MALNIQVFENRILSLVKDLVNDAVRQREQEALNDVQHKLEQDFAKIAHKLAVSISKQIDFSHGGDVITIRIDMRDLDLKGD